MGFFGGGVYDCSCVHCACVFNIEGGKINSLKKCHTSAAIFHDLTTIFIVTGLLLLFFVKLHCHTYIRVE